jgi:hypothetical protein
MMSRSDAPTRILTARGFTLKALSQKETTHQEIASIRTNATMVRQKITK